MLYLGIPLRRIVDENVYGNGYGYGFCYQSEMFMTKNYYYCQECQNTVEFNHECVVDKITRMDMGKAFNTWLKEQPESVTSPIRIHTKALGEVSYALEALERENLELKHQIHELIDRLNAVKENCL